MLICVDLDGTLLDTVPANAASYRAALEELGFTVTDEYYAERLQRRTLHTVPAAADGRRAERRRCGARA